MSDPSPSPSIPPFDDDLIAQLLDIDESRTFETKRVAGQKLTRALESVVAFANTDGGFIVLGLEDKDRAAGRDRVFGIQENPTAVDELRRLAVQRITPTVAALGFVEIGCTLRDGTPGSVMIVRVDKSPGVHSIVADGTWIRLERGNRELVAEEITRLALERGTISAESRPAQVAFDLLDTDYWRMYATKRRLTRPIKDALRHLGLAIEDANGEVHPTNAAVLLFAEHPGGLLVTKSGVRVFHYKGDRVEQGATPNLLKPPVSFSGPLITQVQQAVDYILSELATGVQMGPLG
ncbi:MAG TPA: RNA-binding domain-containing protein, partial [Phycisphaerae bacterium]|nr:RNA-binding domain-containing protein [Phycisphaerae bacterium]